MDLSGYARNVYFAMEKRWVFICFCIKAQCTPMQTTMGYTQVLISLKLQEVDLSGFAKKLLK